MLEKLDASTDSAACTDACTNYASPTLPPDLRALAAALRALSDAERAALLVALAGAG
jgi:hypothetical protein